MLISITLFHNNDKVMMFNQKFQKNKKFYWYNNNLNLNLAKIIILKNKINMKFKANYNKIKLSFRILKNN